ncbi:hypothetical protein [Microvirga sp. TS319]|uniref:hypothetical protein n=1 Tax=Microvirga sp. TS319 TaxID=3241165 RepID=UPI00351A01BE
MLSDEGQKLVADTFLMLARTDIKQDSMSLGMAVAFVPIKLTTLLPLAFLTVLRRSRLVVE